MCTPGRNLSSGIFREMVRTFYPLDVSSGCLLIYPLKKKAFHHEPPGEAVLDAFQKISSLCKAGIFENVQFSEKKMTVVRLFSTTQNKNPCLVFHSGLNPNFSRASSFYFKQKAYRHLLTKRFDGPSASA